MKFVDVPFSLADAEPADKEREYTVTWVINVFARSRKEAAALARKHQTTPGTMATYFTVRPGNWRCDDDKTTYHVRDDQ